MSSGEGNEIEKAPHRRRIYKLEDNPAIGFTITTAEKGEKVQVAHKDFFYDGMEDIYPIALGQIWQLYLSNICDDEGIDFNSIDNALIQIDSTNEVDVSINNDIIARAFVTKSVNKNDLVYVKDAVGVSEITIDNIDIPPSKGVIYYFRMAGRSGIYFDFSPLVPNINDQIEDLHSNLALCYTILLHPEITEYYPKIKDRLFEKGWFPFIGILGIDSFTNLLITLSNSDDVEEIEEKIIDSFSSEMIEEMCNKWMKNDIFKEHEVIIRNGIERYNSGDYISAINTLTPRAEGLLRHLFAKKESKKAYFIDLREHLKNSIQGEKEKIPTFLPSDFDEYLRVVYFKDFDVANQKLEHSRHSTAHGVTDVNEMTKLNAFKMIMILDQIFYYIS